jgi:hypothetical protein
VRRAHLEGKDEALANGTSELNDGLETADLALNDGVEVLLANRGEGEEVKGANVFAHAHRSDVRGEEGAETLIDVLGEEGDEGRL